MINIMERIAKLLTKPLTSVWESYLGDTLIDNYAEKQMNEIATDL